jgi:hypothetical protein
MTLHGAHIHDHQHCTPNWLAYTLTSYHIACARCEPSLLSLPTPMGVKQEAVDIEMAETKSSGQDLLTPIDTCRDG